MPLNYQSSMFIIVHARFVTTYVSNPSCIIHIRSCQTHYSLHVSLPSSYILNPIMPSYSNSIDYMPNIQERKRNAKLDHILAQPLAQAEESRSGERVSHSDELSLPKRGLEIWNSGLYTVSLRRDPPCLGEMLTHSN